MRKTAFTFRPLYYHEQGQDKFKIKNSTSCPYNNNNSVKTNEKKNTGGQTPSFVIVLRNQTKHLINEKKR